MLPYNEIRAVSEQKIERYRAEAERHRLLERPGGAGHRIGAVRALLVRSGLSRIGAVLKGRPNRPIQPAI
jgi:hypothetical protein